MSEPLSTEKNYEVGLVEHVGLTLTRFRIRLRLFFVSTDSPSEIKVESRLFDCITVLYNGFIFITSNKYNDVGD